MILKSKLLIPKVSGTIFRERLYNLLGELPQKKLTTIVAPAGYGKTVFAAQVVRRKNLNSIWYRLGESDQILPAFLSYLIAGVRKTIPSFGETAQERVDLIRDSNKEWQEATTMLIKDLESGIADDCYFVLEDYHRVQKNREINQTLDFLLENLPPNFHIILISRHEPDILLSRLRSNRELIEIKTDDLAFTKEETELLIRDQFKISLDSSALTTLQQKTGGWIAGLILFNHMVNGKNRTEIEQQISTFNGSSKFIATYLQENVFDQLSEARKEFLLKTSILPFQEVDFCNEFLQREDSREILSELASNQLFTSVLDEDGDFYCYHDLFREFLYRKLERESRGERTNQLQLQAAELMRNRGNVEDALELFISAGEYDRACTLFEECINDWLQHGRYHLIGYFSDKIPKGQLEKYPWYLRIQGYLAASVFNNVEAQKKLKSYIEQTSYSSDENIQHTRFFLAVLCFELGDYQQAEIELKSLSESHDLTGPIQYELKRFQTLVAVSLKKSKDADFYFAEYQRLINHQDMNPVKRETLISYVQCRRYFIADEYAKAVVYGEEVIDRGRELKLEEKDGVRNCYVFVSFSLFHLGRFTEGLEVAKEGLRWIDEAGIKEISLEEVFYHCISANSIGLGNIEEGIRLAEKGLRYFTEKEFYIYQARLHWILSEAYYLKDDLKLAKEHIVKTVKVNPPQHPKKLFYEIYLHHMNLELGNKDEVNIFIKTTKIGRLSVHDRFEFFLLQAHYYSKIGKRAMALRRFQEALLIMEERSIYLGLISARPWFAHLLTEIYTQRKLATYTKQSLGQPAGDWRKQALLSVLKSKEPGIKKTAIALMDFLPKTATADIKVSFFGRFEVFIGGKPLTNEHWKSRQAKTLFKFLAARSTRGYTNKEMLMELLWPNESSQAASKRFHVVLAILRKTLESEIRKGVPSSYILREGEGYRVFLGDKGDTDVAEFHRMLEKGQNEQNPAAALDYYKKAESIYQGEFLEEDIYDEWCSQEREKLSKEYSDILVWLMDYFEKSGDFNTCIRYAEKYLTYHPYEEEIYRRLMVYQLNIDRPEQAKLIFERCRKRIEEGLDSPVSRKTEQLYQKIAAQYLV